MTKPIDILNQWDIGPIRAITQPPPYESASGNVTFIETEAGILYVLKRKTLPGNLLQEYRLLEALAEQGIPVAVPLQTRSGESYVQVGEDCFDLSPRLTGTVYTDHYAPDAEERARQFGVAIAQLHTALRNCGSFVTVPDMDLPGDIARSSQVVQSIWPAGKPPVEPILAELATDLGAYYRYENNMMPNTHQTLTTGRRVCLRDWLPADVNAFLRWQIQGQWRLLDAPWEGVRTTYTEAEEAQYRQHFLEGLAEVLPSPRKRAAIALLDEKPIGWVIRYGKERSPETWMVGIDIFEDGYLEHGLGSEALHLWVDYLFANSTVHRIGLDTWSFNPRMMRVAEKVGFTSEGAQREVLQWQGQWLDLVHYGILREEWEKRKVNGTPY